MIGPSPAVQTEEKKTMYFDNIQPEEAKKIEKGFPEEEKESFTSVIIKEGEQVAVAQAKEKPSPTVSHHATEGFGSWGEGVVISLLCFPWVFSYT
jgi:hypothetical protein